jgi:arsenite-transporting ATPase
VLEPGKCTNDYFRSRNRMQDKYLREIRERFQLPVAILPLFETEITGLEMVKRASQSLYGIDAPKSEIAEKTEVAV